ncbi:MAG: IPT/TIG domain-containing protein [Candidatus Sericytochromatia bacterium]|nr:IPT/TIG domain-containing protein [Candidatus Tanganyikabacteria bacterium]
MGRVAFSAHRGAWLILVSLLVALAAACAERQAAQVRLAADAVATAGSRWLKPQVASPTGTGTLNLTIYWPVRNPRTFRPATIPDTTQTIVLQTKQGETQLREDVIARPAGAATSSISFSLPAGNNYALVARAYRETAPLPAGAQPIAQGGAVGLNILASKRTKADIDLVPASVPGITGLDVNAASPGQTITLTGQNLGMIGGATPSVYFGSIASPRVTPLDATSLRAQVPSGATICKLFVWNDGVPSVSNVRFYALAGIALAAPREPWDATAAEYRLVKFGAGLKVQATPDWLLASGEIIEAYQPLPGVVWASSNPLGGSVDETGQFTASRANVATDVTATIGATVGKLRVTPVGVHKVVLDRTGITLNAPPAGQAPESKFTTAATVGATVETSYPFNGGVTWQSSDEGLATVSVDGTVRALAGAQKGTAVFTARAVDDPAIAATGSVTITVFGDLDLGVD